MAVPWLDFDAADLDGNGADLGLSLNGALPVVGDQWNFNAGFIGAGPFAVWSWHMDPDANNLLEAFTSQSHGVLTFVASDVLKGAVDMDAETGPPFLWAVCIALLVLRLGMARGGLFICWLLQYFC